MFSKMVYLLIGTLLMVQFAFSQSLPIINVLKGNKTEFTECTGDGCIKLEYLLDTSMEIDKTYVILLNEKFRDDYKEISLDVSSKRDGKIEVKLKDYFSQYDSSSIFSVELVVIYKGKSEPMKSTVRRFKMSQSR